MQHSHCIQVLTEWIKQEWNAALNLMAAYTHSLPITRKLHGVHNGWLPLINALQRRNENTHHSIKAWPMRTKHMFRSLWYDLAQIFNIPLLTRRKLRSTLNHRTTIYTYAEIPTWIILKRNGRLWYANQGERKHFNQLQPFEWVWNNWREKLIRKYNKKGNGWKVYLPTVYVDFTFNSNRNK